ncbi:hypothetical protein PHYPO_G00107050 [Pangasianodon hypophthalmus]|uniref:Immunoglobulin domain-containing protein n=1 Tax=Pangasianodon hypophthalmus TaxID=310915 RepID=A0A5N5PXF3_PANHP|nr:hypothetical protein PHYPO_G00107050 [Pangasianodon hypophthalmus]
MKILLIFTLCLISDGRSSKEVRGYSGGGVHIKCKVMIRELTIEDTGKYQFGIDIGWKRDIHTPVELEVKEGAMISKEVTAYAGGGINIKYRYEDEYKYKPKFFCKIGTHQWCFNRITAKLNSELVRDGRFSVHDYRSAGFFSVFISELITKDTGIYACTVVVSDEIEIYTVVKLNVREDLFYEKSIMKTVHVRGDLKVNCKYPESHRSDPKFLCRRLQESACSYYTTVKESRKYVNMGKLSLYDDRAKQIFTVSIRNVTEQDSGEYWCGAEAGVESKVYFTQINLTVTDPRVSVSTSKPTQPSSSSSSSSFTPLLLTNKHKSWPTPAFPPTGFPASTKITVSVILLLLLLIGISFLTLTLLKRCKMQGTASTGRSSVQDSGNNQGVSLDVREFEEIKDTRHLSASDTGTSTVYSTVQKPTIPSDPQTVYTNTELPTSPCDFAHTVYSTAQLPTNPPDQDIYSTAQLPPSLSAEKSAEGLTQQ